MKRNLLFNQLTAIGKRLAMVLTMLLIVGIGQVWGAETTVSWTATSGALGSGIGNGTIKTGSFTWNYNRAKISGESSTGYNDSSQGAIRLGKNGGVENITFTTSDIPGMIKSIIVECASYQGKHNLSINVGGNAYYSNAVPAWGSGQIGTVSSSGNSSGIITISFTNGSRALYIKSISVTYEENSGSGATPGSGENGTVTMTAGTNGSTCTVNGIEGIKVGTSSKGGDMSITIPAGATMLHIYAAAWNNVNGLSLNITPTDKVTITSIALKANSGIANNSPFTLSGNEHDYQFDIPLQNITTETTLKFTSSSAKRFVVWGATYETSTGTTETTVTLNPDGGAFASTPDGWIKDGGNNYRKENVTGPVNLPNPTKTGYNFDGWYDDEIKVNSPYTPSETVTLTAKWTAKTTSITLDASNNGSGTNSSVTATYNQLLPNFTACSPATGYTLDGYYTATTGGTQIIDKDGKLVSNVLGYTSADGKWVNESLTLTLYAQYKAQQYTVTFNSNGGTAVDPQTVDHGTKATKPANPTKTGYKFAGWYTEADTEFNFNTPIESATTLYAKWTANQYTITLRQQWGPGGTETVTVHFNNNDFSVSPIIVPTRNGYTFGGYYTAESGAGSQIIDASGAWLNVSTYIEGGKWVYANNLTLYAKWTQNFTITWLANGQPYHTQTAMMGTTVVKPENPNANELACDDKVFVGWVDKAISGSTNDEPTFVTDFGTIQANKTYYAVFAKLTGTPSNDYNKITDINDLTDGEYVIAYSYNGGTQVVLKNTTKDANYMNASALAPSSNKYTSPSAEYIWQLQKQDDGSYYIYNSSVNKFLYATTSALQLSDNPTKYTISYDNNYSHWKIKLSNNTSYYMHGYVNGSSYDFRVSTSGSGNNYRVYLYKNASTAVYSDYVTTCVEIPTPHWEGAEIDNANIAVDCGAISFKSNASKITFDKNYDLTYSITLTASEGFWLSTNQQKDVYEQSVTVTPVQSGDNKGKITQSVYVRADATGKNTNFDGTITISGDQLIADQILEVHAVVDCPQYTLTFNDCGDTETISNFAGTSVEEMEPWAETCSEPFQYVFDGWATEPVTNGTEGYEKVDFSTFTMPNNNTTILYAVYRYAEEGGEPVNGYVKVTEALADWSGDYVIVDDENLFAIKNAYRENTNSNKTLAGETVTIENDKVVSPSANIVWSFSKNGNGYTMYSDANKMYAGVTGSDTRRAILSSEVTDDCIFKFIYDNTTYIAKVSAITTGRCFQYYVNGDQKEWRTYSSSLSQYNTGYLYRLSNKTIRYTSSLVCGTIEAEDAIVTSTVGQTVKVNVPITLNYSEAASITGTSDNEAFTVVTKNDVAVGESTIEVHYKPTAYVNTANQEETATITLTTSNGATTTFNITGRCLPETFAILAKVGNVWYALPSQGLNSETTPVGYPVKVDNNDNPTVVTSLPTKAEWALRNVYKVNGTNDRFAANGENLVFVNAENKTLYANNGNANIQTYAEYTNYAENNPDRYEWVPTTTDLVTYTLKNVGRDKDLSINVNATFGTHASNIASNNLRFLSINATYNPFDMQVVEWYPTKVLVQTEAALTSVSATVGGIAVANPVVTKMGGKLYEISGLPLENNPTKILTISYDSYSCSKVIPIIISCEDKTVTDAPFSTLTTSAYNYSDLVVRDGATLTINGTKQAPDKFVNVTIYPTAKIVVPENKQLSVYSLTFFGGIDDIYDGEKYTTNKYGVPQFSLKGTLGKTVTTMDYIMRVNTDQMYSLGLPYDVALADIKYWDGSAIGLGTQLYVSAYDGQARANREKKTWIYETDFETKLGSATLKAGVGYTISAEPQAGDTYSILRMPMKSNISSGSTEGGKTVSVTGYANTKGATITDNHKGWNLLSNPYMTTISGDMGKDQLVIGYLIGTNWVADTYRYVTIPGDNGKWYYQQKFTDAILLPFKSFFVQVKEDVEDGILSFALANRQNAPARLLQQDIVPREVEFELLLSNETQSDNMGLLISEEYTPAYEINADLEKMTGTMSVYTIYNGYTLAYNALSPLNAEEQIPVGYIVPANGEYTFDLKEDGDYDKVEHIYLIDREMDAMVDLLEETYDFYAVEKKNNNRFAISVILKSEQSDGDITTNLGEIDIHNKQPQKFFYDGELYILHDGKVYSATGHEIQTINQ